MMLSLLSSALPLVLPLSSSRTSMTSSEQEKKMTAAEGQTDASNLRAWSIFRGKPSTRNRGEVPSVADSRGLDEKKGS
jgi:hypothetical protein